MNTTTCIDVQSQFINITESTISVISAILTILTLVFIYFRVGRAATLPFLLVITLYGIGILMRALSVILTSY